jgi:hypothetical protein
MLRHSKILAALLMLAVLAEAGFAFTIWGPLQTYQTTALCYSTRYWYSPYVPSTLNTPLSTPGNVPFTELGGPAPFNHGSRLNVGVITYAYDVSFLEYYGAAGVQAVDAAFDVLNGLPQVSKASADLTEFITQDNQQINYTARALSMLDLKSCTLQMMIEHMGLLGETHVYDLLGQGGTCGDAYYEVTVNNYDPVTWNPSTYVNGINYSFQVFDGCSDSLDFADAMETIGVGENNWAMGADFSAVATQEGKVLGGYYLGLTRDDFGGLRYLYNKNNFNNEALPTDCWVAAEGTGMTYSPVGTTNTLDNAFTGLLGGQEHITFKKVAFDSYIGTAYATNVLSFKISVLTNSKVEQLMVWRTNVTPDIIITASNLLNTPAASEDQPYERSVTFIAAPVGGVAPGNGPEVISPTMTIAFNNVGPIYYNVNIGFVQQNSVYLYPYFQMGSYDGSTNAPVVFPQGFSLAALDKMELAAPNTEANSPFNPVASTNTTAVAGAAGAGTGTTTVGAGGAGGAGAAVARPK